VTIRRTLISITYRLYKEEKYTFTCRYQRLKLKLSI
jgi:hypothetical protein